MTPIFHGPRPRDIMFWLSHYIPNSFLEAFLQVDLASVRESWSKLLTWSFTYDTREVFVSLMAVAIRDVRMDKCPRRTSPCFLLPTLTVPIFAHSFISRGISPDAKEYISPAEFKFSEPSCGCRYAPWHLMFSEVGFGGLCHERVDDSDIDADDHPDLYHPLAEAAVRGSARSMAVLIGNGADIEHRCGGYPTAAGHVVLALGSDDLSQREPNLSPTTPSRKWCRYTMRRSSNFGSWSSDQTLLDTILLLRDPNISAIHTRIDPVRETLY